MPLHVYNPDEPYSYDSIETASRRLAISFLKHRGDATESVEVFDDLKEQDDGTLVEVTVRLITRTPVQLYTETIMAVPV